MRNITMKVAILAAASLISTGVYAESIELTDIQMDGVAAGGSNTTTGFVCPVISTDAVLHAKNGVMINGAYSILGPQVSVPSHATNTLDDGTAGSPGGAHASPGDTGYTAIWNTGS